MTDTSNMEPHVRAKARWMLKAAAGLLWNVREVLSNDRRSIREIREALEGYDRKSGLIGILNDDAADHWSVAANLPGYALILRSISLPTMGDASKLLDDAHAVLQDGLVPIRKQ